MQVRFKILMMVERKKVKKKNLQTKKTKEEGHAYLKIVPKTTATVYMTGT